MWFTSRWVPLILKLLKFHHGYRHRSLSKSQRSSKCFQTSECCCRGGNPLTTNTTFPQYFPMNRKMPIPLTSRHHPMGFRKQMDHQELCEYVEAKFAVRGFISWRFHIDPRLGKTWQNHRKNWNLSRTYQQKSHIPKSTSANSQWWSDPKTQNKHISFP